MKNFRISRDAIYYQFIEGIDTNAARIGDTLTACKDAEGWHLLNAAGVWYFCPLATLRTQLSAALQIVRTETAPKISAEKKAGSADHHAADPGTKGNAASRTRRASSFYHNNKKGLLFVSRRDFSDKRKKGWADAVKVLKQITIEPNENGYSFPAANPFVNFSCDAFIYKDDEKECKYILTDIKSGCMIHQAKTIKEITEKLKDNDFIYRIYNVMSGTWYAGQVQKFAGMIQDNILSGFNSVKQFYNEMLMSEALEVLEAVTA